MVKYIQLATKLLVLLPYLLVAFISGIIAGTVVKCSSKPAAIPVKIEMYNYESDLKVIREKRDSMRVHVPTIDDASGYLYDRYDREASANHSGNVSPSDRKRPERVRPY